MSAAAPVVTPAVLTDGHEASRALRRAGACTLVILGGGGDLTRRKLIPALAHLAADGLLDDDFTIIGVGRDDLDDDAFRAAMDRALDESSDTGALAPARRKAFLAGMRFVRGDLDDAATYAAVKRELEGREGADGACGRLFYLAIPPSVYPAAIRQLSRSGIAPRTGDGGAAWVRVVIEKPFGSDLASAKELNQLILSAFDERQVYRIDHYLGKETVQNIMVLRFANSILEPIWNRTYIEHVQITAAETVGVEHRAGFYEEAGVFRDMFQNHLMQLLTLTAMEPPNTFAADAVRGEKVKVLDAIAPTDPGSVGDVSAIGQYGPGAIDGTTVRGYRDEPGVAAASRTPTYAALRLEIDNWRWQGVPFFLRSGKRLARHVTEIAVRFRRPPHLLFRLHDGDALESNTLVIRIQPEETIALRFEVKRPGVDVRLAPVRMLFSYEDAFGPSTHPAYETLLLDCMLGDATLFSRVDEVEAAWRVIDPLVAGWQGGPRAAPEGYAAGDWGPAGADALLARDGAQWRRP